MAPTPTDDSNLLAEPTSTAQPDPGYWTKANIAVTAVFALLALAIFLVLLIFFLRHRSQKKKRHNRKSDKAGLLDHQDDKTSMFSRERHSSVTIYLDEEANNSAQQNGRSTSQDRSIDLVPLQITPVEESHSPVKQYNHVDATPTAASNGSGVSSMSRLSSNTASTMMLSPIGSSADDGDLSIRQGGRPRSTSTASQRARYYESTPTDVSRPPIPTIIRTPSD
ncbi:hypothetical protein DE146DRAFT_750488 [Phaeosphaeria sp. MPI-PUGE-AT-0046c]|nr:hypothetical protein DE146DRAFT_750488 [Phaeosphaeria sp. MPI-PUGE-AT-0046c]